MLGACDSPAASRPQAHLERASFLTTNEKRVAAGYGTHEEGDTLACAPGLPIALKYDPNQPRAPRGDPDGGQWTDGGGGGGVASSGTDDRVISDATPDDFTKPGTRLAQNDRLSGYPVDLREEQGLGGHAIEEHVNVTEERLQRRVRASAAEVVERGEDFEGLAVGSFTSLEAATKLVNSTISQNADQVERVVRGEAPFGILRSRFDSITGYEVYLPRFHAEPFKRETNGVTVFIIRDTRSKKGYRVQSAFPQK